MSEKLITLTEVKRKRKKSRLLYPDSTRWKVLPEVELISRLNNKIVRCPKLSQQRDTVVCTVHCCDMYWPLSKARRTRRKCQTYQTWLSENIPAEKLVLFDFYDKRKIKKVAHDEQIQVDSGSKSWSNSLSITQRPVREDSIGDRQQSASSGNGSEAGKSSNSDSKSTEDRAGSAEAIVTRPARRTGSDKGKSRKSSVSSS